MTDAQLVKAIEGVLSESTNRMTNAAQQTYWREISEGAEKILRMTMRQCEIDQGRRARGIPA